jgi:hypothetical protein
MAQIEKENPGKRVNASGADRETIYYQDTARVTGVQSATGEGFRSKWWSRNALDAICASRRTAPSAERMTFLCAAVAMDWMCFADRDGLLFRSAEDTAQAIGAAESNVREAASQLLRAGLAEIPLGLKKQSGKKTKGRDATTYRLLFVDISRLYGGGKSEAISAYIGAENQEAISAPIGGGISAPIGADTVGRTGKGAGARLNAPPAPVYHPNVVLLTSDYNDAAVINGGGARERAPALTAAELEDRLEPVTLHLPNAADTDPEAVTEIEDGRGPVTLADLERLAAEEQAAKNAEALDALLEPDPITKAAADLAVLFGDNLADPHRMACDLFEAFAEGDPEAADRAAGFVARSMRAAGSNAAAAPIWNATHKIVCDMVLDASASQQRAASAVAALSAAVRVAGLSLSERRAEIEVSEHAF